MNPYFLLIIAIVSEVFGSSMLKLSKGFTKWLPSVGVLLGMGSAFFFLSQTLKELPLGVAYAIWSGVGTALTAIVGVALWKEALNVKKVLAIALIIAGVILMKLSTDMG
ncbi:QacE family quaternary ammonium compound efflux SMR transporter [Paenibacillus pinisoli]|uniref:QacE family quaternary ammonium compound efflux SMR transporter n=1 Tax=Paenibacillus pinisoli TaxID=1276110 RepID=A0A3A6PV84_9BACL|nr:multidrug efflux SMR transporter [Paenibacillus pinisoli]RJX37784.1 QacE family quaternary ammonium compound efflux SMR transporter [Paenibacillus pinisoli]